MVIEKPYFEQLHCLKQNNLTYVRRNKDAKNMLHVFV
jgi:hypothetical protein